MSVLTSRVPNRTPVIEKCISEIYQRNKKMKKNQNKLRWNYDETAPYSI